MERDTVTLSSKGQLTIPSRFRKELNLKKGMKILLVKIDHQIVMRPLVKLSSMLGVDKKLLSKVDIARRLDKIRDSWNKEFEDKLIEG